MLATVLATGALALGLVLIVEGLVYALAPGMIERMLEALRSLPPEARRVFGLAAMAAGVLLVWLAKGLGA
ncbi:DUF2065 domain-containing protein [Roseovarius sp. Pro17]|uniref:DUF2065 domain-containing protein n=1 Tax=Roseovarius sp. Pro17 TaxID=3108175 RepID=UPI002D775F8B|nr:DUF2065 domain-containing protein [Roseovarius sp. Pro17]